MKSKLSKTNLGLLIILISLIIITAVGCFFQERAGEIAYAANESTSTLFYTNGDWNYTWSSNGYSGDKSGSGACKYGDTELLDVRMFSEYQDGTGTMNKGDYINWSTVTIYVKVTGTISSHVSFQLYKDGSIYKDDSLSGSASKVLLSQALPDGAYNFIYKFNYYVASVLYKYTYTFNFNVDNSAPQGTFLDQDGNALSGYTNKAFKYVISESNLSSLQYRKDNGSWNAYLSGSYISEQGSYSFKAVDTVGNTTQENIVLDNSVPTLVFKDLTKSKTIENAYNSDFYCIPTDTLSGIFKAYYKYYAETSWTQFNPDVALTGLYGTYNFKAIDRAGNESNEYTLIVDPTPPTLRISIGATEYPSNSSIKEKNAKISFSDMGSGIAEAYYTLNGVRQDMLSSGVKMQTEGIYNVYVKDVAGNEREIRNVLVDYTAPTYTFNCTSGKTMSNGGYTNKPFRVNAQDNYSNVSFMGYYLYTDKDMYNQYYPDEFIEFNANTLFELEGQYYFKFMDSLGNTKEYITCYIDLQAPELYIYNDYGVVEDGAIVNTNVWNYDCNEDLSNYYVYTKSGDTDYYLVTGYWESHNGWHYWYAMDEAGNTSDVISYYLDTTKPTITLYYKGNSISKGSLINDLSSLTYEATDDYTDIEGIYYSLDDYNYTKFTSFNDLSFRDGRVSFKSKDEAGNWSYDTYLILDTTPPSVYCITSNVYSLVEKYTASEGIYIRASDTYNCKGATIRNSEDAEPQVYYFGTVLTLEGRYIVSVEDNAGNITEKVYYIDRTVQVPTIHNVLENVTNGDVYITWEDIEGDAPLELVTVNGVNYSKGDTIYTIYNGQYQVYFRDICGNEGYFSFISSKKNILTDTVNKLRYETTDLNGHKYSFETYAHALDYRMELEESFIEVHTWIGPDWDEGIQMDYLDSINAKAGTYYLYKSEDSKDVNVAYFTVSRILDVMRGYAAKEIQEKWYWEGELAEPYEGENLFSFASSGTVMANEIHLGTGIFSIDGERYVESIYNTPGTHEVVVEDGYTNSFTCTFVISSQAPDIGYSVNDNPYLALTRDTYYLTGNIYLTLLDNVDADSVLIVMKDNVRQIVSVHDKYLLTNGRYEVYGINRCFIGESKTIYVSNNEPKINASENSTKKRLEVSIISSPDLEGKISNIYIYKDDELLTKDDFKTLISADKLNFYFQKSGNYKIVVEDKFRSGLGAITLEYSYVQPKPQAYLYGVENNGYTNGSVNVQFADNVSCFLYKDDVFLKSLPSRERIEDEGRYRVYIEDLDGNEIIFSFIIDKSAPVVELLGVERDGTTNKEVTITWNEGQGWIIIENEITLIDSGTTFIEDGEYYLIVEDEAGNNTQFGFKIDTKVDYKINVLNGAISNSDVILHSYEDVEIALEHNGALMSYAPEESIQDEGEYTLTIKDSNGNMESMNFRIIKHTQKSFNYTPANGVTIDKILRSGEPMEGGDTLNLTQDGNYSITIWDGEVYYTFNIVIDTTPPQVTLEGVENGGTTKSKVKVTSVSEDCTIIAKRNGEEFKYAIGESLEELGKYEISFIDSVGNTSTVTFEIVYSLNGAAIALIVVSSFVLVSGAILLVVYRFKKIGKKTKKEEIDNEPQEEKKEEEIELD